MSQGAESHGQVSPRRSRFANSSRSERARSLRGNSARSPIPVQLLPARAQLLHLHPPILEPVVFVLQVGETVPALHVPAQAVPHHLTIETRECEPAA